VTQTITLSEIETPELASGIELIGEYQDSGLVEPAFLVRNAQGNMLQLPHLMYCVLQSVDGSRNLEEIAHQAASLTGRPITAENVSFLLAEKLQPAGLLRSDEPAPQLRDDLGILVVRARLTLVTERWVNRIARVLAPLFQPAIVVLLLAVVIGLDIGMLVNESIGSAFTDVLIDPKSVLASVGLVIASMVFHEFGHAAACRYGGARPGEIGAGLYLVWPAFFTNATDSYRLNRAGRLRVDLGGVYFNAIYCIAIYGLFFATHDPLFLVVAFFVHAEIAQQLLPSLRLDGYLILSDLTGIPDLFGRFVPVLRSLWHRRPVAEITQMRRTARVVVRLWVLFTATFIAAELLFLLVFGWQMFQTFIDSLRFTGRLFIDDVRDARVLAAVTDLLSLVFLILPVVGGAIVLTASVRQFIAYLRSRRRAGGARAVSTGQQGVIAK
jgi:putative peptide zinc metalloprotease protein